MKNTLLITALTLTLISGFSAQAANRTAVATPAVAIQTGEVKTLNLEQITTQVSPEMRAALEEIRAQALSQAQAQYNAGGKVSVQDFHLVTNPDARSSGTHIKEAKLTVNALKGGGFEISNPSSGEKIKISLGVSFKPLTVTLTVEF